MTIKIGVIGGGQLGRMLAINSAHLGVQFIFLEPNKNSSAAEFGEHLCAKYDDENALTILKEKADIITFEFENVPAKTIEILSKDLPCYPHYSILETTKHRIKEKTFCNNLDLQTAKFFPINSYEDLEKAANNLSYKGILKTVEEGYDGKGQFLIKSKNDLQAAFAVLNGKMGILEEFINFDFEVSIIASRNTKGEITYYPLIKNTHKQGILRVSEYLTFNEDKSKSKLLQEKAELIIKKLLIAFDYVGTFTIEFFVKGEELIINELAPRVHNSGHLTIESTRVCQFENHIRSICGFHLGDTKNIIEATMFNCISEMESTENILKINNAVAHSYNKEFKENRKVGHITYYGNKKDKDAQTILELKGVKFA